ncbi:MAG: 16S rRNA (guanine(966)-N(2))-methyltransferase RsmD [Firmicutes bacterium]|nr:16S rRNA (guanine(966)-N(2))-methyltransferase RsmD [Bacillota bacterium]
MRVIAGLAKGCRLKSPEGRGTRPTADRVKESLFAILSPYVLDARVLDLFAGTGNLGIEALSRGAGAAVFVEKNRAAVKTIRENLATTGLAAEAAVMAGDCRQVLSRWPGSLPGNLASARFDLVLIDPPYGQELADLTLGILGTWAFLAPEAVVVAEHGNHDRIAGCYGDLEQWRQERYGETILSFFRRR